MFYSYVTPNNHCKCGLLFGLNNLNNSILIKDNYFVLIISNEGYLILSKILNRTYSEIIRKKIEEIYYGFDKRNTYKLTIKYFPYFGKIIASLNEIVVFDIFDNSFNGGFVGLVSLGKGTIFSQIIVE